MQFPVIGHEQQTAVALQINILLGMHWVPKVMSTHGQCRIGTDGFIQEGIAG